jgi:3-oxoacyl-[acyl-carrier protein] reductase
MRDETVALVIGGTRGIGAAISRRLAADGASVAMLYASREAEAEELRASLEASGTRAIALKADAADPDALEQAMAEAIGRFGRLDILVCVAGAAAPGPIDTLSNEDFDRTFAVNVRAPFIAARAAARVMTAGGRIVFVGSIVAERAPGKGAALYAASKSALRGLTRALARDLGERGITANLVQPGPIDTERNPADGPNAALNRSPLAIPRHGTADEVAALVAYLVSPEAGFTTGSAYNIDGGWSA